MSDLTDVSGHHRVRALYFSFFSAIAAYFSYIYVYLDRAGLTGTQIGMIASIGPIASVVMQPFWGVVSDVSKRPVSVLRLLMLSTAVVSPLWTVVDSYHAFLTLGVVIAAFNTALPPLIDSVVLGFVLRYGGDYGSLRGWGSMGYAVAVLVIGWVLQRVGIEKAFLIYSAFLVISSMIARGLPEINVTRGRVNLREGIRQVWTAEFTFFVVSTFILYVANAAFLSFFGIYMKFLGAGEGLMGLAFTIGALSEIPFFLYSKRMSRRFRSQDLLVGAFVVFVVRFFLYSVIGTPIFALLIQPLYGLSFGLFYAAAVDFVNSHSPSELRATVHTIFWAFTWGLGPVFGNWLAGFTYERWGVNHMFFVSGIVASVATVLYSLAVWIPGRKYNSQTMMVRL